MLLIWRRWRGWRRGRPFWGGLLTVLAGTEIAVIPLAPLKVMLHQGTAGLPTVVLGLVMVVLGLSAWFGPQYRGLAGVLTVLLAAAALVLSNLGGFMIGTLLGVVGGALIFAWRPVPAGPPPEGQPDAEPADGSAAHVGHPSGAAADASKEDTLSSLASAFSVPQQPPPPESPGTPSRNSARSRNPEQD